MRKQLCIHSSCIRAIFQSLEHHMQQMEIRIFIFVFCAIKWSIKKFFFLRNVNNFAKSNFKGFLRSKCSQASCKSIKVLNHFGRTNWNTNKVFCNGASCQSVRFNGPFSKLFLPFKKKILHSMPPEKIHYLLDYKKNIRFDFDGQLKIRYVRYKHLTKIIIKVQLFWRLPYEM